MPHQADLFAPALPPGFAYREGFLTLEEERALVKRLADLPFSPFEFHGFIGKRRVISFGWRYDFNKASFRPTEPIPDFLLPVRDRAAAFAGLAPEGLPHLLLTEYAPGAAIGWHKDRSVFAEVVGVSLLSPCTFRFRRSSGSGWERLSLTAAPRSAYLLRGPSRTEWEHSIPPVDALRYSLTFRSLASA